jgi:hypothetical protein
LIFDYQIVVIKCLNTQLISKKKLRKKVILTILVFEFVNTKRLITEQALDSFISQQEGLFNSEQSEIF